MAGPATLTPAIVVGMLRYGETSRVVRLATRDMGVQVAMAKGVARPRSRFVGLQLLSEGTAHLIPGRGEMATLAGFDVSDLHSGLARSMTAFYAATALAELVARGGAGSEETDLFAVVQRGLRLIEVAPPAAAEVAVLAALWRCVVAMGFEPVLDRCSRDGSEIDGGAERVFSVDDGGVLCRHCARGGGGARLTPDDLAALEFLVNATGEPPDLDRPHALAHRRLLARWIARHLDLGHSPALDQWLHGASPT